MAAVSDEPVDDIRVLHVDDEPDFADMVATFLEREDDRFDVETATSATEGLALLADGAFDCVVSDYDMPGQNGIAFLEAVREDYPDLPFILFTGKGSEDLASDAISAGVTDYLQKESGTEQYAILANRISNCVAGHRSSTEAARRRHRLEQILKTVPGCVVQLDTSGQFVYANRRAVEVLGLEQSAVTGRRYDDPDWDIRDLDGDPIPDEELPFRRVLDTEEPLYGVRHTIQSPDGERKILLVNGAPVFDRDGTVGGVVFSLTDITDQYERERELRAVERRLQLALEATDTGVWEWDVRTDEVAWSDTLERVMGLEPGAFEGTFEAFVERVHPDDLPDVRARIEEAIETESTYEAEFRMFDEDGAVRWVAVRGRLIEDGRRMVGVHQDITERKDLAAELAATADQYRTLLENFPDGGVFLYNDELECLVADGAGLGEVGLSPDDMIGGRPSDRYPEPVASEIEAHLRAAFEGEEGEFEQTYDGRHYRVRTLPVRNADGAIDRVMAVSQDVTEHAEREQQFRLMNRLVQEMDDGAVIVKDGVIEYANPQVSELVGYSADELVGAPMEEFIDPEFRETVRRRHGERLANGINGDADNGSDGDAPPELYEIALRTSDDERIPVEINASRIEYDGGPATLSLVRNVSGRKRRERELQRQNERLEEFASVVSHDLRNPLALAAGRLELAREECESQHLAPIGDALDRMDRIIEDVLWLAREGRDIGATEPVALADLIDRAWTMAAADRGGTALALDFGDGGPGTVEADDDRIVQLLENLFRNAFEHGGERVTVTVGPLADGFYVADDGPGIPVEQREAVFEAGHSTAAGGTGFGLSLARRIAEAHGWSLRVTESESGGARFEVTGVEWVS